jgi:hypothetical protein
VFAAAGNSRAVRAILDLLSSLPGDADRLKEVAAAAGHPGLRAALQNGLARSA